MNRSPVPSTADLDHLGADDTEHDRPHRARTAGLTSVDLSARSTGTHDLPDGADLPLRWPTEHEVAHLHWPRDAELRERMARAGVARVLHVAPGVLPPPIVDELEDWVRSPADAFEVATRAMTLSDRARRSHRRPRLDDNGLFHVGERWVALPPGEATLARVLLDRMGQPVSTDELWDAVGGPGSVSLPNVRTYVSRLRRRLAGLGVDLRSVRGTGLVLEVAPGAPWPAA